jgi:two-component system sensor histidine kinase KdpD
VRIAIGPDLPLVDADAAQLERVFANLLENASRYSDHGPVVVNSRVVDGRVLVRVVDQGPGIPEADQERIFQPFQHGNSAASGSGLGLAIAKGFVEANGGDIAVESMPGQGTAFVVSLNPQRQMAP